MPRKQSDTYWSGVRYRAGRVPKGNSNDGSRLDFSRRIRNVAHCACGWGKVGKEKEVSAPISGINTDGVKLFCGLDNSSRNHEMSPYIYFIVK